MGSKYPRSLRCCLPLWALELQTAFSLLFCFFIPHDTAQVDHRFMASYQGEGPGGGVKLPKGRGGLRLPKGTGAPVLHYSQGEEFQLFHWLQGDSVGWALGVA